MSLVADSTVTRVEGGLSIPGLVISDSAEEDQEVLGQEFLEASSNTSTEIAMETDVIQDLCSITSQEEPSRDSSPILTEEQTTFVPGKGSLSVTDSTELPEDGAGVGDSDSEKENTDVVESQPLATPIEEEGEGQVSSSSQGIGEDVVVSDIIEPSSDPDPAVAMGSGSQSLDDDDIMIIDCDDEVDSEGSSSLDTCSSTKPGLSNSLPPLTAVSRGASSDTVVITKRDSMEQVKIDKAKLSPSSNALQVVSDINRENSEDDEKINNIQDLVQKLSRSQLDKIIQDKLIEAISVHSNVGQLNQKLLETEAQKDRLVAHVVNLQKQVKELMKAIKTVTENAGRNQGQQNRGSQPVRFYRSVGVQVVLDSPLIPVPNGVPEGKVLESKVKTVLKSGNNNNSNIVRPLANIQSNAIVTQINGNSNPGLKRPINYPAASTMSTVNGNVITDAQGNKLRRVVNGDATAQSISGLVKALPPLPNAITLTQFNPGQRNPGPRAIAPATNVSKTQGVVVDLTDDDTPKPVATSLGNALPRQNVPVTSSPSNRVMGQNGNLLVTQNGVIRFINPAQPIQYLPGGLQILQNGSPARPLMLTGGTLPRLSTSPMVTQQRQVVSPQNQLVVRGILPNQSPTNKPAQVIMRSIVPKPTGQTIPTLPPGTRLISSNANTSPAITNRPTSIQQIINKASPTNQTVVRVGNANVPAGIAISQPARPLSRPPEPARKFTLPPLPPPAVTGNPRRCPKDIPPRPDLSLKEQNGGIVLSWTLKLGVNHAEIQTYQIYACQEPLSFTQPLKSATWKRVGDVKALPLPMACTLSQFSDDNRYHFIVRGVDVYNRTGPFCEAAAITLKRNPK